MKNIGLILSQAIKEGKWVHINYENPEKTTYFWVAVISIKDIEKRKLGVKIYNDKYQNRFLDDKEIYFDKIITADILEGTTYEVPESLIDLIETNLNQLEWLQYDQNHSNILSYLSECAKYDKEPYQKNFAMIDGIDDEVLSNAGKYELSLTQIDMMVTRIKKQRKRLKDYQSLRFYELVMNILSIDTKKGLFVIAYKKVFFNPEDGTLVLNKEININSEFLIEGHKHSLYSYLDDEVFDFHINYVNHQKEYHEKINSALKHGELIDERPYLIELIRDISVDFKKEFNSILEREKNEELTVPLKAFFGINTLLNKGKKDRDIMLLDDKANIDQLRVIHNALKNPVTYVQGPPGTGKTQTILNVIVSAFFNNISVLITSNNNKPIDSIFKKIKELSFNGNPIPFPIIRLGNNICVLNSLNEIKELYERYKDQTIYSDYLNRNKENKKQEFKALNDLLNNYEEKLTLEYRLEALNTVKEKIKDSLRTINIQSDIDDINRRIKEIGEIKDEDVLKLLKINNEDFYKWLYYTSIDHIKKLKEPKYKQLMEILNLDNDIDKVREFNRYLSEDENLSLFLRVFPIVLTTNMSATKLGSPKVHFDLTIMDEAGQCSVSYSLLPIIRGKSLLLVGDQNQLEPVIVLDQNINKKLMQKYEIIPEYNYINNSILRLMQSVDHISKYILMRYHYRSHKDIISFSNKKYYAGQLIIETDKTYLNEDSLTLLPITTEENPIEHNTSEREIDAVIQVIKQNDIKNFGFITPFHNQAELAKRKFEENGIKEAEIGTIHTFQGDEKDVIFISTAITKKTSDKAFEWVKNNKELINVASTRPKERLILTTDYEEIKRRTSGSNDILDLLEHVKTKGNNEIKVNLDELYKNQVKGYRNYNTKAENEFLDTVSHYLTTNLQYFIKDKVKVATILDKEKVKDFSYFNSSEFDFVIFEKGSDRPILAFELDGLEHIDDPTVIKRDEKKQQICLTKGLTLKRIPNDYARRYEYIKDAIKSIFKN